MRRYRFGPFELDAAAFELRRDGAPVPVQPKVLELLLLLVRRPGALLTREEATEALWPDVTVTDQSLRQVVHKLRDVLGAGGVETVPRVGLRFVLPVRTEHEGPTERGSDADLGAGEVLPTERDPFFGRERELDALDARIREGARLVSVTGPGGVGKTRLALHLAHAEHLAPSWWCDLSDATSLDGIVGEVAHALGVTLSGLDPTAQLGHAIAARGRCLLWLDNFEQVAAHAEATVGRWLERAPEAAFVVTTRTRLGLRGEVVSPVPPLSEPDALALFVARARAVCPGFEATGAEAQIAQLVGLVDRLPLAIELVAARAGVLTIAQMRDRLADRFRLLAAPEAGEARQGSLRATIDWSWNLLSPVERDALARLSVFAGGFSIEAADAVLDLPHDAWGIDVIQALVDRSLVVARPTRFDLLLGIRDYAAERLRAAGAEEVRAVEARHGAWASALVPDAPLHAVSEPGGQALRQELERELDNLAAACRRAVDRGDGAVAARTLQGTWCVLMRGGPKQIAADLAAAVLGMPDLSPPLRGVAAAVVVSLEDAGFRLPDPLPHLEAALAHHQRLGERRAEGFVRMNLGRIHNRTGRSEAALRELEEALCAGREAGDWLLLGLTSRFLGFLHFHHGRIQDALERYQAELAVFREHGSSLACGALGNVAAGWLYLGRIDRALRSCEEFLREALALGHRNEEARARNIYAATLFELGEGDAALRQLELTLALHRASGSRAQEAGVLGNTANILQQLGRSEEALALYQTEAEIRRELGLDINRPISKLRLAEAYLSLGRIEEATAELAVAEDALPAEGFSGVRGLLWTIRARLHLHFGRLDEAERCCAEAERLIVGMGDPGEIARVRLLRAEIALAAEDAPAATRLLDEIAAELSRMGLGPASLLGRALRRLRSRLSRGASGTDGSP